MASLFNQIVSPGQRTSARETGLRHHRTAASARALHSALGAVRCRVRLPDGSLRDPGEAADRLSLDPSGISGVVPGKAKALDVNSPRESMSSAYVVPRTGFEPVLPP